GRVPKDDVFILEDDQVRDEQVGQDQAPPGLIASPVLQDILARMLNFLEGMTQAGQPAAVVAPRIEGIPLSGIATPPASRPIMTYEEQKMFERFRKMDLP
ncbi:hypothetical protein HAX54_023941, partial [Datura stramonium]|nr:hypothetical protein [Datura stramonium]